MAEPQPYDLIIAGTGPAGLTAAIYGRRFGLRVVVFGDTPGGNLYMVERIMNYPGFTGGISGTQLGTTAFTQAQAEGAVFPMVLLDRLAEAAGEGFLAVDADGTAYTAPAALVATGRRPKILSVPNADKPGIHFCSICDGPLYRDRGATLAVIGGGDRAGHHALTLANVAGKVLLVTKDPRPAMETALRTALEEKGNVEIRTGAEVVGFTGEKEIHGIEAASAGGETETVPVDGVFLAIGWLPNLGMLDLPADRDADGYLVTGDGLMTSRPGLFAAGDVRTTDLRQVVTACADGARAATGALDYLERKRTG